MPILKIKDENGKWIRLPYIIKIIQGGELDELTISKIEELIVSYFENKTVKEVEG